MVSRSRLFYVLVCVVSGLICAWVPSFLHGPMHQNCDLFYLNGAVMVWEWRIGISSPVFAKVR
jgi:hypothetical protein